jgi:hypothetical protein
MVAPISHLQLSVLLKVQLGLLESLEMLVVLEVLVVPLEALIVMLALAQGVLVLFGGPRLVLAHALG